MTGAYMEVVGLIEGIGESLLHYACLNNSNNMPFFVTFLMENGVDPTIKNKYARRREETFHAHLLILLSL